MGFWNSLAGSLRIRITSASVAETLTVVNHAGVPFSDIKWVNDLTVDATILRQHYKPLRKILSARGDKLELVNRFGVYWTFQSLGRRPVFLAGILLYIAFAVFLPTRIFFVTVTGNETISAEMIITHAEGVGISFGASRSAVRSERVKNALLAAVPELQWAGVNTYGCVAVISVRERNIVPKDSESGKFCSIVAKCDGVIQEITVTRGNVLCKVGQAVKAGQVLVSGYTDCGISIKVTAADGEIYAHTVHQMEAVAPTDRLYRGQQTGQKVNYSLIIGKKLIKLYKDSGISDIGCVKMYHKSDLTLPGGFVLPVALITETYTSYTSAAAMIPEEELVSMLTAQSECYMLDHMLAGKILIRQTSTQTGNGVLYLNGKYGCLEMIGQIYNEEIIKGNE